MRYAVINQTTGQVTSVITSPDSYQDGAIVYGALYKDITSSTDADGYYLGCYFKDTAFKPMPTQPSKYHSWSLSAETWNLPANWLQTAQADATLAINGAASKKIISKYPYYKQMNIGRAPTASDATAMFAWIDSVRNQSKTAKAQIAAAITPAPTDILNIVQSFQSVISDL